MNFFLKFLQELLMLREAISNTRKFVKNTPLALVFFKPLLSVWISDETPSLRRCAFSVSRCLEAMIKHPLSLLRYCFKYERSRKGADKCICLTSHVRPFYLKLYSSSTSKGNNLYRHSISYIKPCESVM